jgi:hypothetical protein
MSAGEEPTQAVKPGGAEATADVAAGEDATATISGPEEPTKDIPAQEPTKDIPAQEPATRDLAADASAEDKTTSLVVLPGTVTPPASDDGDEKTQLLTLPKADGPAADPTGRGERTQVIQAGTVEPPGDRTQLLSFPAPAEPVTVATPVTSAGEQTRANTSIVAAERPDPGEDPTTRLTATTRQPGEATTRANPDRPATTATSLERPADEAEDDTRPLTLPTPRPPADDDTTRRL